MGLNKEGAEKMVKTLLEKDPHYFKKLASKGGSSKKRSKESRHFAYVDREKHLEISRMGGLKGRGKRKPRSASQPNSESDE